MAWGTGTRASISHVTLPPASTDPSPLLTQTHLGNRLQGHLPPLAAVVRGFKSWKHDGLLTVYSSQELVIGVEVTYNVCQARAHHKVDIKEEESLQGAGGRWAGGWVAGGRVTGGWVVGKGIGQVGWGCVRRARVAKKGMANYGNGVWMISAA